MQHFLNIKLLWLRTFKQCMLGIGKILVLPFFLVCCTKQQPVSYDLNPREYEGLKKLFLVLLFEEGGAYTLFGDKPVTFDVILPSSELCSDDKEISVTNDDWEDGWQRVKSKFKTPLFLLVERSSPLTEGRAIFFVNIRATALTLKRQYSVFKDFIGFDFDPLQVVFEIEDESSLFWTKVLQNEYLLGTLLGFGDGNAWLHQQYMDGETKVKSEKMNDFLETVFNKSPSSNADAKTKEDIEFSLPSFGCYSSEEGKQLLEKYKYDRERIRKLYKGKDLVEVTLDRLTSKDLPEDPNSEYKKLYRKLFPKKLSAIF